VARSAQHEVQVEQNQNGAVFLCTLRQEFQFNGIRMGYWSCFFSVLLPFQMAPFTVATFQFQGSDTFLGKNGQYNDNPSFEDILSINDHYTFTLFFRGIKHIARRAYSRQSLHNLHPANFAIRALVNIEPC